MKTHLASMVKVGLKRDPSGRYYLYPRATTRSALGDFREFARLRQVIRESPLQKLSAQIERDDDFWRFTRVGVILGDVTLLSGTGPVGATLTGVRDSLCMKAEGDAFIRRVLLFYDDDVLQRWARDAEPFIQDGRVVYLPSRGVEWGTGDPKWVVHKLVESRTERARRKRLEAARYEEWILTPGRLEYASDGDVEHLESLAIRSVPITTTLRDLLPTAWLFEMALPFISDISLRDLHRVLEQHDDTLASFRAAVANAFIQYVGDATGKESLKDLERVGLKVRRDIIEPELEMLTRTLKRVVESRAIRLAGATLGTVSMGLTAAAVQPLSAVLQAIVGSGGLGLIAREYAEYRAELNALKDNPWYFAWSLRKTVRRKRLSA